VEKAYTFKFSLLSLSLATIVSLSTFLSLCFSLWINQAIAAELTAEEVKAGVILNFAKYTEWQNPITTKSFIICTWKENSLGDAFLKLNNKTVQNLPVTTAIIASVDESKGCNVVFFDSKNRADYQLVDHLIHQNKILSITEGTMMGVLSFEIIDGKLQFYCDLDEAKESDIKFSSQLLKLAKEVVGKKEQ
jgi:hypothetical protein